jgi:hypothetical protein
VADHRVQSDLRVDPVLVEPDLPPLLVVDDVREVLVRAVDHDARVELDDPGCPVREVPRQPVLEGARRLDHVVVGRDDPVRGLAWFGIAEEVRGLVVGQRGHGRPFFRAPVSMPSRPVSGGPGALT